MFPWISALNLPTGLKRWKAKKNPELIEEIRELLAKFTDVRLIKVKGHAGVPENERADELARMAVELSGDYEKRIKPSESLITKAVIMMRR